MKIYSWNILYRNKSLDDAFEFISHADFDAFCLQEVPGSLLKQLQTLSYSLAFRTDTEKKIGSDTVVMYNVILSKFPTTRQKEIPFPDYWTFLPWHTHLFVRLMPSRFFSRTQNRGGLFVDLVVSGRTVRVFNLHLALAHPAARIKEFEQAMLERDPTLPTIVCGDFNILESPHITPLNWIMGGTMRDMFFSSAERTHIEKRFVEHSMTNALRGSVTHPLSKSQLDHILVSHDFSIKNASVLPSRTGSDHHPILVEVA